MKNLFAIAFLALSVAVATAQTKTISLNTAGRTIRGVDASSAFKVDVTKGNVSSAVATVSDRYADNVTLTIDSDGVVKVGLRNMNNSSNISGNDLQLKVVCPSLEEIDLSSAAVVNINSDFSVAKLDIDLSSAARVGGAGKMTVRNKADIECSSASKVELNIVSSAIEVDASSASKVILNGSTTTLKVETSSSANVDCYALAAKYADVEAGSASKIMVKASETLRAESSSGGSVRYDCPTTAKLIIQDGMSSSVQRK